MSIVVNRAGEPIIPGPYVPSAGTCQWCGQPIVMDGHADTYRSTETGRGMCSPADRGAKCVWGFYREHGIDPLKLKAHDLACNCQSSVVHVPAPGSVQPYPYPARVPEHHGQPARLTPDAWVCRGRNCLWTVPPAKD